MTRMAGSTYLSPMTPNRTSSITIITMEPLPTLHFQQALPSAMQEKRVQGWVQTLPITTNPGERVSLSETLRMKVWRSITTMVQDYFPIGPPTPISQQHLPSH